MRASELVKNTIKFTIPGRPVPKGRPRLGVRGRKAFVYTPPATREYEKLVGWVAKAAGIKPLRGKIKIWITVYLASGRDGDWDNYAKSICDGLNGIAFRDDRDIIDARVIKVLGVAREDERAEVKIWQVEGRRKNEQAG